MNEQSRVPASPAQQANLPDLLVLEDGAPVTSSLTWQGTRATELHALFRENVYGTWPAIGSEPRAKVKEEGQAGFAPPARQLRVDLEVAGHVRAELLLVLPKWEGRPAPCFLGLNWAGNEGVLAEAEHLARSPHPALEPQQAWPLSEVLSRGYALATLRAGDVVPDDADQAPPVLEELGSGGALSAWAWGLSCALDYLAEREEVDASRVAVFGHSRFGKAALLAGARDPRPAVIIPHQSGAGGAAPWRVREHLLPPGAGERAAETLALITSRFGYWFSNKLASFGDDPSRLPVDQHELIALCAPRPVLLSNATSDYWINPTGQREMLEAAAPVYQLVCGGSTAVIGQQPAEGVLASERLGWFMRAGTHSTKLEDWRAWLDYADLWL